MAEKFKKWASLLHLLGTPPDREIFGIAFSRLLFLHSNDHGHFSSTPARETTAGKELLSLLKLPSGSL